MSLKIELIGAQTKSPKIHTPKVTWISSASATQLKIAEIHAQWNQDQAGHRRLVSENTLRVAGKAQL